MSSVESHSRKEGPWRHVAFQRYSHRAWLALTPTVFGHYSTKGPANKEKEMSQRTNNRLPSAHLMGMMLENKRRKRMICRYQRPAKCWRATMTSDTTTRAPKRIFVRQFTSRSNRPIWGTKESPRLAGAAHSPPGERPFSHEHLLPGETAGPVTPTVLVENTGRHGTPKNPDFHFFK